LYTPGKHKSLPKISAAVSLVHHNGTAHSNVEGDLLSFSPSTDTESHHIKASHAVSTIMSEGFGEALTDVFLSNAAKQITKPITKSTFVPNANKIVGRKGICIVFIFT